MHSFLHLRIVNVKTTSQQFILPIILNNVHPYFVEFLKMFGEASDFELTQTPKMFPKNPTWLQRRLVTRTGKTFALIERVQSVAEHGCAQKMYVFCHTCICTHLYY